MATRNGTGPLEFARAIFSDWFTRMSGPLSVPAAAAAFWVSNDTAKILLGITAFICLWATAYVVWRKERKKGQPAKPHPERTLADLLERITGFKSLMPLTGEQPGKADATANALIEIRQKAALGTLTVFARRGDRPVFAHQDPLPLLALPQSIWEDHEIYYLSLLKDARGQIRKTFQRDETVAYSDIWVDASEMDQSWPPPKRRLALRSPFILSNSRSA
jgi:hypothetical protein